MDVALYDLYGNEQFCVRSEKCICNFIDSEQCRSKIVYSGGKAVDLGTSYIYETPCGLVMCISPVAPEDKPVAYIACGPVRLWDDDDYYRREFYSKCSALGFDAENAGYGADNISQISCEYMTGLAEMLSVTVEYMAKEESRYLKKKDELGRIIVEQMSIQTEMRIKENQAEYKKYPTELEKELIFYVQLGDKIKAKTILNNFLGGIFAYASGNLDIIKAKLYEFTAFLSRAAVESGAPLNTLAEIIKKSVALLADNIDFVSICETTTEILNDFLDTVYEHRNKKAGSEHLAKAVKIINDEYYSELSLDVLSKRVFVSNYYLSHLFRAEMGITFSEYLNKVRIDRAKRFLTDGESVESTAEKSGFNDAVYFMKIFKKYVGTTPAKYRKAVRSLRSDYLVR